MELCSGCTETFVILSRTFCLLNHFQKPVYMNITKSIPITRARHSKASQYDFDHIVFGTNPTDHIFLAEYKEGSWQHARIEPFHDLTLNPMALCLHYGQTVFEGLKAYRQEDGALNIF